MESSPGHARGFLTSISSSVHPRNEALLRSLLRSTSGSSLSPMASSSSASSAPTDQLLTLIRHRQWETTLERLLQCPLDARFRSTPNRATPLHFALMHRAPHALIAVLVDAFPAALLLQDSEGWTPLHVNILYGSHEDTTLLLIKRGGRMAASLHSKFVGSPLHLLCRHGPLSIKTLQALVETRPEQVTVTNEVGMTAPNLLYKSFLRRHDLRNRQDAQQLIDQLMVMVKAVYGSDDAIASKTFNNEPSLHQIILFQCHHAKETDMVRLVLELYPHLAHSRDSLGRLPIHIAAAQPRIAPAQPTSSFYFNTPQDALFVLLAHHPSAAAIPDPVTNRLPLFTALAMAPNRMFSTGIEALLQAHPKALQLRDPATGLYAFQLAAMAATTTGDDDKQLETNHEARPRDTSSNSHCATDTTFEILKACPSVL